MFIVGSVMWFENGRVDHMFAPSNAGCKFCDTSVDVGRICNHLVRCRSLQGVRLVSLLPS